MSLLHDSSLSVMAAMHSPASGGGPPAPASWQRVNFRMQIQEQTNWCWCATALSVRYYFVPTSSMTQCEAANQILQRTDACATPGRAEVNKPWYLDDALDRLGHLGQPIITSPLPWSQLKSEIAAQRPVGCRTGWAGGGGHFMCIDGYLDGSTPMVAVDDPIYGPSDVTLAAFTGSYQGSGTWTHSYKVKA